MCDNHPVTNREVLMEDGDILVSGRDTSGSQQFNNQCFVDISGFTEEELIGSPHNVVRHPDMLKEAFANLLETIKAGLMGLDTPFLLRSNTRSIPLPILISHQVKSERKV